jgi:MFS family permease
MTGTEETPVKGAAIGTLSLFRIPSYRVWWTGSLLSGIGSAITLVAYPLLILAITRSPFQAGLVGALEAVPYAVLSLPVGILADRFSRRVLLSGSSFVSMVATGWIPLAYHLGILDVKQIYGTALINGAAGVIFLITQVAAVPQLVPEDQLGQAAGQTELIWNLSALVGPTLAGVLMAAWLTLPMAVDAVSFGVMGCAVLLIGPRLKPDAAPEPVRWRRDLAAGVRVVATRRQLRAMIAINTVGDLMFAGIAVLMTVVLEHRGATPTVVGLNFALAAAGGVIGSLFANRIEQRFGMIASIVTRSWVIVILFPLMALPLNPFLIGFIWCIVNVMIALMNVVQMRYMMTSVPNDVLGRAQSFMTLISYAALPVGVLLTGIILDSFGPRVAVLCFGGVFLLVAIYASFSRSLRHSDKSAV